MEHLRDCNILMYDAEYAMKMPINIRDLPPTKDVEFNGPTPTRRRRQNKDEKATSYLWSTLKFQYSCHMIVVEKHDMKKVMKDIMRCTVQHIESQKLDKYKILLQHKDKVSVEELQKESWMKIVQAVHLEWIQAVDEFEWVFFSYVCSLCEVTEKDVITMYIETDGFKRMSSKEESFLNKEPQLKHLMEKLTNVIDRNLGSYLYSNKYSTNKKRKTEGNQITANTYDVKDENMGVTI